MITLTNATILTVDSGDHFYEDGRVVVDNGRIAAVGPAAALPIQGEEVDLRGGLVMPGLINTHTHSHSSLFRNQADDLQLMDWLKKAMWPMEKRLSPQRAYAATALSCLEYLRCGITTYANQFYYADTIAQAAQRSGLRCFLAATVFYGPLPGDGGFFRRRPRLCGALAGAGGPDPRLSLHRPPRAVQRQRGAVSESGSALQGL